jgi:uncharacterized protein
MTEPDIKLDVNRRRGLLRAALGVFTRVAIAYAIVQVIVGLAIVINPNRNDAVLPDSLRQLAFERGGFERMEFYATDGVALRGELLGGSQRGPVVIFGHGYRMRRRGGDPLAADLLARNIGVLLFDFRGCGASSGGFTTAGALEDRDVAGAIRCLESRGIAKRRIGYVGYSMGAVAGVQAAKHLDGLAAAVFIAPYERMLDTFEARTLHFVGLPLQPTFTPALWVYRLATGVDPASVSPIEQIAAIKKTPILLLGGEVDWRSPVSSLESLRAAAGGRPELVILPRLDHLDLARLEPITRAPIVDFLEKHLPTKSK